MKETLTDVEFAYMAGIIDGEGCLSIFKLGKDYKTRQRDYLAAKLTITNTSLVLLDWIVERFGGKIGTRTKIKNRKTCYYWHAHGDRLDFILEHCTPFLTEKKNRGEVLKEFRKTFDKKRWVSKPTPSEIHDLRLSFKNKLHEYNLLGI